MNLNKFLVVFLIMFSSYAIARTSDLKIESTTFIKIEKILDISETLKIFGIFPPYYEVDLVEDDIKALLNLSSNEFDKEKKYHLQVFGGNELFFFKKIVVIVICDEYVEKMVDHGFASSKVEKLKAPMLLFDGEGCFSLHFLKSKGNKSMGNKSKGKSH